MKAIVYEEYGSPDVLQVKEIEKPVQASNEIRIKIHAANVGYGDITARNFKNIPSREFNMPSLLWLPSRFMFGFNKPRTGILGAEFAGEIEAIGQDVSRFRVGDQVFAYVGQSMGANAEYRCMPEDGLVAIKPANMTYEEAATIPYGGIMALSILRKVNIQPGQSVLVNGASGGIGSLAVQLAKHYGAIVTGVCGTPRLEYVKSLGADKVVDYTQEDFTQSGETYDVIFDILGKSTFAQCKRALKPNGIYLLASFKMKKLVEMLWTSLTSMLFRRGRGKKVICAFASEKVDDLIFLKELAEEEKIKAIIDRCYPLEQTAQAHGYIEAGQKKGNVVISVMHNGKS
jgi:NADPH:quinone reductase-like Zn-dependent oxidoreductase